MAVSGDWLTLPEAAARLGISVSTARRWIRESKLQATKQPGPYGLEYRIPLSEVTTAQEVKEVVQVQHPVELAHVAAVLERHLTERDGALRSELQSLRTELLDALRTEVREGVRQQVERIEALEAHVAHEASEDRRQQADQLETLRTEINQGVRRQEELVASLRTELAAARTELTQASHVKQLPWWQKVFARVGLVTPAPRVDRV